MAITATVKTFAAGDAANAKVQLEALAAGTTDKVFFWQQNNVVYVAKVTTS